LALHYESLSKDRDPRQQFRQPVASDPSASGYVAGAGVVGPMGSSGLTLPSVEKVMKELEGDEVSSRLFRTTGGVPRRVGFLEFVPCFLTLTSIPEGYSNNSNATCCFPAAFTWCQCPKFGTIQCGIRIRSPECHRRREVTT